MSTVFLMIRFREAEQYELIASVLTEILDQYSLALTRADYKQHHDELWANVRHCMDNAAYGIAVFEHIADPTLSPNVSLELGYMLAKGKRCLLLREKRVPALQADLVGHLCHEFDCDRIPETLSKEVRNWLRDLGIAKRKDEKVLAFISSGGTCRDPMAKAITLKLLEANPPGYTLRVDAGALFQPSAATASSAARQAITEMFGSDLLANYQVKKMTAESIAEADLILVMADTLLIKNLLPSEKTFVLKPFFGLQGNIEDPYPDGTDQATLERYRRCAAELREAIEGHLGKLIDYLRPRK
jgi:protein-tyrosine-phosphatase